MFSIKTPQEIEVMAKGGKILAGIMAELEKTVRPGITTQELDRAAEALILNSKGKCSFKGYGGASSKPYPACLCTSINEEIVHAVPSDRILKEGDIISLDLGIFYQGFHTDMAITVAVGKISPTARRLVEVTKRALNIGIEKIKPGNKIGDISKAIQKYVEGQGFNVVRELCGHGIGRNIHEDPQILNSVTEPLFIEAKGKKKTKFSSPSFDKKTVVDELRSSSRFAATCVDSVPYQEDGKIEIKEGMVLCLEPMVTIGDWRIKKSKDGFGYITRDNSLSAHFEHTIVVTKNGAQILTVVE